MKSYREYLKIHFLFATVLAIVAFIYVLLINTTATKPLIFLHGFILWVLTPPALALIDLNIQKHQPSLRLLYSIPTYVVCLFFITTLMILMINEMTAIALSELIGKPLIAGVFPIFAGYIVFLIGKEWRSEKMRTISLEHAATKAQLASLGAQFNPHFLFNTFASLEGLIDSAPGEAKTIIYRLSDLYRKLLENSKTGEITIDQEWLMIEDYLNIQAMRFTGRFRIEKKLSDNVGIVVIPSGVLLGLLENVFKHAVETTTQPTTICFEASLADDLCRLSLRNDLKAHSTHKRDSLGHGLEDVRERFRLIYGDAFRFSAKQKDDQFVVDIQLLKPKRKT